MIGDYRKSLETWREAGLISDDQVAGIEAFESERARAAGPQIPAIVEVLIYLGVSAVVGSLLALLSNAWEDLGAPTRSVVLAVFALAGGMAGTALRGKGNTPLTRASMILWIVSVGFAWGAGAVLADVEGEASGGARIFVAGSPATLLAVVYYAFERRALMFLAVVGSVMVEAFALQDAVLLQETETSAGILMVALGVITWVILGTGAILPRWLGEVVASFLVALGFFVPSFQDSGTWAEVLGLGVTAAMLWLSIQRRSTALLAVGSVALFGFITKIIFEHVADTLGAPLALLLTGAALIGTAVMMTKLRPRIR